MRASELRNHLADYLVENDDCEVKLYCESVVYDDSYDESCHEVITDIRAMNDWPLPGESIIFGDSENPGKYLVIFYDSNEEQKARLAKRSFTSA